MVEPDWEAEDRPLGTITNCYRPRSTIHTDMKPIDHIGLYLIVIVASGVTVNGLFRIHFRQGQNLIVLQITMPLQRSPPWSYDGVDPQL